MKILFINYEYPPIGGGGANANAYMFKEYVGCSELEIDCVTSCMGTEDRVERIGDNITLHRLAIGKSALHYWTQREVLWWLWRGYQRCRELTATHNYDLCHAFFGFPSGAIAYALRARLPYIVSLRGSDVPGFNPRFSRQYVVLKPLFRRIWSAAEAVVANSVGLQQLARQFMPRLPLAVIPNGIDTAEFSPSVTYRHGDAPRLLCVSRLVERKGVQHLVEAFATIHRQLPEARLTLVGEGDLLPVLQRRAAELGVAGLISFAGYVPHDRLPTLYRQATVFVQPSYYEGMSNTVLEAMASGLPIVATGQGGMEELYRDNARMAAYGDPHALAGVLLDLLGEHRDHRQCRAMGASSRAIALEFSWGNVAERYREIYRAVLTANTGGVD